MLTSEESMIHSMLARFSRSPLQVNGPFDSDAEIVRWKDGYLLVTTDEFSQEDHFREHDPHLLGWNCAAGAVTDILASGGVPRFYLHSLVAKDTWESAFVEEFARGCAELLGCYNVAFLGGDFGRSALWRCTATVIGETNRPVLRSGARPGDGLYVTGAIGGGNLEAMLKLYADNKLIDTLTRPLQFRITPRPVHAEIIARYASACIDTSDGLFMGLYTLAERSRVGFCVRDIPYESRGVAAAFAKRIPRELLFLCEAGEYELLTVISSGQEASFLEEIAAAGLEVHRIGEVCEDGRRQLRSIGRSVDLSAAPVRARDYSSKRRYVEDVRAWFETASA